MGFVSNLTRFSYGKPGDFFEKTENFLPKTMHMHGVL